MIWLWITLLVAGIEWFAAWKGYVMLNRITKPAVLISLILWFSMLDGWQSNLTWFGFALVLSLAGDIFLLVSSNRAFLMGLASFMTAHFFYVLGFNQTAFPVRWESFVLLAVILTAGFTIGKVIVGGLRRKNYTRRMIIPVMVYTGVICLMLFSSLLTLFKPTWPGNYACIAAIGGILFTTSDSILGYDRFVKQIRHGRFWVMLTYHLAQLSLIASVLLQSGLL